MKEYHQLLEIKQPKPGFDLPTQHPFSDEKGEYHYTIAPDLAFNGRSLEPNNFIRFTLVRPKKAHSEYPFTLGTAPRRRRRRSSPLEHLKFHISLPEKDRLNPDSDFSKAYRIIIDILFSHRIASFKVIKPKLLFSETGPKQRGKEFTIYCKSNPEMTLANWQSILTEITQNLVTAQIQPGYRPEIATGERADYYRADSLIPGSSFITYRIDNGIVNPIIDDPSFHIDVDGQLEPETYIEPPTESLSSTLKVL